MKVLDSNWKEIKDYDLKKGYLSPNRAIKKDAIPPDDITKFAWDDEDYEEVMIYELFPVDNVKTKLENYEKLMLFAKSIPEEDCPELPPKIGFKYTRMFSTTSGSIVWTMVPDINNPIAWEKDMWVDKDLYYLYDNRIYLCLQSGEPTEINEEYFKEVG